MRECFREVTRLKAAYILGGSTDSLLPRYETVGFRSAGPYFTHAALNGAAGSACYSGANSSMAARTLCAGSRRNASSAAAPRGSSR